MSDQDDSRRSGGAGDLPSVVHPGDELDPPPTADEIAASQRLRDALGSGDAGSGSPELDLVASLKSAWAPEPLDERVHAEMLDELPSAEELLFAAELRDALEHETRTPEVVVALRAAWSPAELGEAEHRAIVVRAVGREEGRVLAFKPRGRAVRIVATTSVTVLALAASIVLWMMNGSHSQTEAPLARVRSTQPLFGEPFKAGETSARIDRIAMARSSDYRDNRFAKWGVR